MLEIVLLLLEVKVKFLSKKVIPPDNVRVPLFVEFPRELEFWSWIVFDKLLADVLLEEIEPPFKVTVPVPNASSSPAATVPELIVSVFDQPDELSIPKTKVPSPLLVIAYDELIIAPLIV